MESGQLRPLAGKFIIPLTTVFTFACDDAGTCNDAGRRDMMHPLSPWAMWDRTQPGSLKTRLDRGHAIHVDDLIHILDNYEDNVSDPLLRELLLRALRGGLRKPRGRPRSKLSLSRCMVADVLLEMEVEEVRGEIASGELQRTRGDLEPKAIAADKVAKRFGNITGRHLSNQISRHEKCEYLI